MTSQGPKKEVREQYMNPRYIDNKPYADEFLHRM